MSGQQTSLSAHDKRQIAVKALCDVRSVEKYLRGDRVGQMLRLRVEAAMREIGFGAAVRA